MKEFLEAFLLTVNRELSKTMGSWRKEVLFHAYTVLVDKQELNILVVNLSEMKFRRTDTKCSAKELFPNQSLSNNNET